VLAQILVGGQLFKEQVEQVGENRDKELKHVDKKIFFLYITMPGCIHPAFVRGKKVKRCRKTKKTTASLRGGNPLNFIKKSIVKPTVKFAKDKVVKPGVMFTKNNLVNAVGCVAGSAGSCALLEKNISKAGESAVSSIQKLGEKGVQEMIGKGKGKVQDALGQAKKKVQGVMNQGNNLLKGLSTRQLVKDMMLSNPTVLGMIAQQVQN